MRIDTDSSGLLLRRTRAPLPQLVYGDRRYKAMVGDLHDVWEVLLEFLPALEDDEELCQRVLDEINDRRLVAPHRFEQGRAVEFLFNRELLERELRVALRGK